MTRRRLIGSTAAVAAAAAWGQSRRTPPNVVILLADDLGWADVGFHGSEIRTPNIDLLAKEGVELERFYSFPVCSPTRSALMTGRSPMRLGLAYSVIRPWLNYGLPMDEHLMPESFRAAGYQTAITGKWHLGHSEAKFLPHARGFDHAYGHVNGAIDYFEHSRDGGLDWHRNGRSVEEKGYSTDLLAAEASRFIRGRDKSRPFFLYVPFNAPHTPLQAPEERIARYAARIADPRRRTFAAMVDALDEAVGGILATIAGEGLARDTIVLFFSDNGGPVAQAARNTPLRGAKGSTWEGGIHVPAAIRWTGRLQPGKSRQVMTVWDVFPTLAAAAGIAPRNAKPFDGRDLWPQISSASPVVREPLFFAVDTGLGIMTAMHDGEWKLVREPGGGDRLFRIGDDPNEQHDVAAAHSERVRAMAARIVEWQSLMPPGGVRLSNAAPPGWKAPPKWAEGARR